MPLHVLVTVGSTSFASLTDHIMTPATLSLLSSLGATHLTIQHGAAALPPSPSTCPSSLAMTRFAYTPSLADHLARADLVVSHAGAGTISEALARRKRMVVVVNDMLMHNHQTELASAMANRGCCVMLGANELGERFEAKLRDALAIREECIAPPAKNKFALANVLCEQLRRAE